MRTTVHSKIKESPFKRHYGRKPRTELTNYLNLPTDDNDIISAQLETLQVYSFNNGRGGYDQLIMKTPRKLKSDVSNNFQYKFLEKRHNKNKFESEYQTKPKTAVAGTKHAITTNTNKKLHRKLVSKPLPNSFQNPLSRRGKNRSGIDEQLIQKSLPSLETEDIDEEETQSEEEERESTPITETSTEQMEENFNLTPPTPIGRGRPKFVRNRDTKSPGSSNLKLHVDNMNEQQLEQAIETITENPTTTTIVDNTSNENQIKTEINEIPNTNE